MARQTQQVIAYARNENVGGNVVERKEIQIPDNCTYVSHTTGITTASPQDEGEGRWSRSDGVVRRNPNNRIASVWVEANAGSRSTFGINIWVGVQLTVTYDCPD